MSESRLKIFSGNSNRPLAEEICKSIGEPLGEALVTSFPDGETFVKINENIRGHDVFIIQSTCPPTNHHLMELLIMIDAARRASAQRITAVLPFYGYARQDRKDQPRVAITAKLVANLLVSAGANRVLTMDLHSQQIQGFFDIPVDHLYASPVFFEYLATLRTDSLVVCSPDVGGMKMASAYATVLGAGLGMVAKKRKNATTVEAINVVGEVDGCDVLLVDDITETAGTLTAAAKILREHGARSVRAAVSHCVLNEAAFDRLRSGLIDEVITTNSVPITATGLPIKVLSIATLLGQAIQRINTNESVTSLFRVKGILMNRAFTSLLAFAAAVFAAGLPAKGVTKPVLRIDTSPVSQGRPAVLTSYADVVEPVQRAVVSIYSTKTVHIVNPLLRQLFGNVPGTESEAKEKGLGSGVIVSPDGYILTNNHVVEGADELKVSLFDGREFIAKVIGTDQKTDLAVIKIDAQKLPTIVIADSDKLRVGDIVFAVGNPLDVGPSVTMGIVSAKGRRLGLLEDVAGYENFIQTDAAINLGNSGGALVDAKGRLIGINSAIISPSRGNIGLGFAVPINLAASVMQSLIDTGTVARGYLGVGSQTLTPELADQLGLPKDTRGVIINDVAPGSPAEKAGLKSSDVILSINGSSASDSNEMRLLISEMAPGAKVSLKLMRDGKTSTVDVTLSHLDDKPDEIIAGVSVQAITDDLRRKLAIDPRVTGLLVTDVDENSPYAENFAPNMVIVSINQAPVSDPVAVKELLSKPGRYLLLIYYRGGLSYITLAIAPKG